MRPGQTTESANPLRWGPTNVPEVRRKAKRPPEKSPDEYGSVAAVRSRDVVDDLAQTVIAAYASILGALAVGGTAYWVGGRNRTDGDETVGAARGATETGVMDQIASGGLEITGWIVTAGVLVFGTNAIVSRMAHGWKPEDKALYEKLKGQLARIKTPEDPS